MLSIFAVGRAPLCCKPLVGMTVFARILTSIKHSTMIHVVPLDCMRPLDGVSNTASFKRYSEYPRKVLNKRKRHHQLHKELQREEKHLEGQDGFAGEDVFADAAGGQTVTCHLQC